MEYLQNNPQKETKPDLNNIHDQEIINNSEQSAGTSVSDKKSSENIINNFFQTVLKKSIKPYLIVLGIVSLLFMILTGPARFIGQWFVRDGYGANVVLGYWIIDYLLGIYLVTTFYVIIIHIIKSFYRGGSKIIKLYKKMEALDETKNN